MNYGLFILILITSSNLFSQNHRYDFYQLDFEDSTELFRILWEPVRSQNTWEIGTPQKTFFTDSKNGQGAICTLLENPYDINDTSSFIIEHIPDAGYFAEHSVMISGYFKVDCDSLHDIGKIEFSGDKGEVWIDLSSDTISSKIEFSSNPVFTGLSDWTFFEISFPGIGDLVEILDTVYYRFTFISDSIFDNRDGLMFDDLTFDDWAEGIKTNLSNLFSSKAFPNPSSNQVEIAYNRTQVQNCYLKVYDASSSCVYEGAEDSNGSIKIDVSGFSPGIYLYQLQDERSRKQSVGKFVVGS